jgi:hypothetical protein
MKNVMKQALGAVALSAMALSMIGTDGALAKGKSAVMKPTPPDDVTTTEKGKSATIPVAPPTVAPQADRWVVDAGLGITEPSTEKGKSSTIDPPPPSVAKGKSGVLKPNDDGCNGCNPSAARNKTGWLVPLLGVAAVGGGILAATGGGSPKSP